MGHVWRVPGLSVGRARVRHRQGRQSLHRRSENRTGPEIRAAQGSQPRVHGGQTLAGRVVDRRQFAITAGCALVSAAFGPATSATGVPRTVKVRAASDDGRLTARPRAGAATSLKSAPLGLGRGGRDGVFQMPSRIPDGKVPLLVYLHGASGNGAGQLRRIGPPADQAGVAVLAPDSRNGTWDAIRDGFGEDVEFLNRALALAFERLNVDPARVAIGGFSDGASYALSLGLINGDLFPRVVVGSP